MHLLPSDARSLDTAEAAVDLALPAGDVVFLAFTDADLTLASASGLQGLVVAPLYRLRHPLSVDLFVERSCGRARAILVRLLGGLDYWRYGVEELAALARRTGAALAIVPGDGRPDPRLATLSTITADELTLIEGRLAAGGVANVAAALRHLACAGGLDRGEPSAPPPDLAPAGLFDPATGLVSCPIASVVAMADDGPRAALVCYRSTVLSGDTAPLAALAAALQRRGFAVETSFVASLKDEAAGGWIERRLRAFAPHVIVNATAFSALRDDGTTALDIGVPVLQVAMPLALEEAWQASSRGLGASDLAMHVVLPEVDGRLFAGLISTKQAIGEGAAPLYRHRPHLERIEAVAARAAGLVRLRRKPNRTKRLALIVSNYPGVGGRLGHAVGLDTAASAKAILTALAADGYDVGAGEHLSDRDLIAALTNDAAANADAGAAKPLPGVKTSPAGPPASIALPLEPYRRFLAAIPVEARDRLLATWGEPEADPACHDGAFHLAGVTLGNVLVAVQPDRGNALHRKADHHDPDRPPRHAYLAFYHWLRTGFAADALVHLGTHGTLEWLPGKAVALSQGCYPDLALGELPVVYPFIVNNPGEAAQAKRRLAAVTIGHATPPLAQSSLHDGALEVERLIDEYAAADGLDPRRMAYLRTAIVRKARDSGLAAECGIAPSDGDDQALARLDAFLCDVKDLSIRDGLHVFGADLEMRSLIDALSGRFVPPGPSGAPSRGRPDVLPTGRNLFTIDPRAVPTRAAVEIGKAAAAALVRRHAQDHGEPPRRLVVDLWGSTTMRTGGDDFAQALAFLGVVPVWDQASNRVNGFEILPLAKLDWPRIDVTLKVSGLFRDVFQTQIALFDEAIRAVAALDEDDDWNALAAARRSGEARALRVFGAAPQAYGAGVVDRVLHGEWQARADLGRDYLSAGAYAYGVGLDGALHKLAFEERVRAADAHVHVQDHGEIDVLDSVVFAAHQGGFAAAAASLGAAPSLWHLDLSKPAEPKPRTLAEEVARVAYGRAAHPAWIAGMMRHGHAGGAELANAVDALFAFAATAGVVADETFDRIAKAYLENAAVVAFLAAENPAALAAIRARLAEAMSRGLWRPRRNVFATLVEAMPEAAE